PCNGNHGVDRTEYPHEMRSGVAALFCQPQRAALDLVVSSTLALDATHHVEWYVTDFIGWTFPTTCVSRRCHPGMRRTCTSLLWSRKKAEAARARWPSDLQSRRWRMGSASRLERRIHKARYRNGKSGATIPIRASSGSPSAQN